MNRSPLSLRPCTRFWAPALLSILGVMISQADAAPTLNLQATSVTEGQPCGFTVSGTNFEFQEDIVGYCSGTMFATAGGLLSGFVNISTPGYGGTTAPLQGATTGYIDVPQNPGRYAEFFGSVSAEDFVTVPSSDVPFQSAAEVSLMGSFTACLFPLHEASGPCDPAYTDFANINVDIIGQDVFSFTPIGNGEYTYDEAFTGTLAPVPEPASGSLFGAAFLCAGSFLLFRRTNYEPAKSLAPSTAVQ